MRNLGTPKTNEERRLRHISLHGTGDLPARGTGLKYSGIPMLSPNKIIIATSATAAMTSAGIYFLSQGVRGEKATFGAAVIMALGGAMVAGLTSFLITRYIGE